MRVISLKPLRAFWEKYPDAKAPLRRWYRAALNAEWRSLLDIHQTYPQADGVTLRKDDTLTVFNMGGNKYRLVTRIRYDYQLINVRHVLTHDEYDRGHWKE